MPVGKLGLRLELTRKDRQSNYLTARSDMRTETMRAEDVIRKFNQLCQVAMLATVDGDRPRVRPMAALAIDGNELWMAADAHSGKLAQLARNPHVELCYMDAERRHLRLQGTAEEVNDDTMKQKLWDENPMLHQYFRSPDSPDYRLIKIVVTEALLMDTNDRSYQRLSI